MASDHIINVLGAALFALCLVSGGYFVPDVEIWIASFCSEIRSFFEETVFLIQGSNILFQNLSLVVGRSAIAKNSDPLLI